MNNMRSKLLMMGCGLLVAGMAIGQRKPATPPAKAGADTAKPKPAAPAPPKTGPKAFKEVITDKAIADSGLFNVYKVEDKYYFEIPNSIIGRDVLAVARIAKAAAGARSSYAGDEINENVIRFEKGPANKVFMKNISYLETGRDSTEGMYKNVLNSNLQPISAAFPIAAFSKDSSGVVIDMTDYISGDNDIFFFDSRYKRALGVGGVQMDKSYIISAKSYPKNIEIRTMKTYSAGGGANPLMPVAGGSPSTLELNTSLVLLPEKPMQARYFDDRIGYFTTQTVTDFDKNPQGIERFRMIARYRLEPKPEDVEKYKRGELVEPQKQIVYYIDPTTPKKWIPYLIAGVSDWSVAFEKAGFKNAIVGKVAPTYAEDSTFSLEDATHSAIVYKPSDIPNASGPQVHDPRSGEIIESHINWYHNVMSLVHDWYMVQTAAVDPKARKMEFDEELMGQLIRFVSSHEVGHTLGLRHNFGSSSTTPVEKLRDKAWVEANGHTASIMDYARFNYVAQPEDNITETGLFPRIGDYDKWAIEWGYRWFPDAKSADDETAKLNKWVIEKLAANKRLWWGDGESFRDDPRSQTEDLSDNAMKASTYGIKNLKRIIVELPNWTKEANKDYASLQQMYGQVISQFGRYIGHVSRNIGGLERTPKRVEQTGNVYDFTSKATQKEAMGWLQTNVFVTPTWVIQKNTYAKIGEAGQDVITSLQNRALSAVISPNTWEKLFAAESANAATAYTVPELLADLRKGIFSELTTKAPIDAYRRNLQKNYAERLISLVGPAAEPQRINLGNGGFITISAPALSKTGDGVSIAKMELRSLLSQIKAAAPATANSISKAHLLDLQDRIQKALDPK